MHESVALAVLVGTASLVAGWSLYKTRDLTDPRVIFPSVYGFLTAGPVVWNLYADWYYAGIPTEYVPYVLLSASSAIVAFALGATLGMGTKRASAPGLVAQPVEDNDPVTRAVRQLASFSTLALLAGYLYVTVLLKQTPGATSKELMISYGSPTLVRFYYLTLAGLLVSAIVLVTSDTRMRPGRPSWPALVVLGAYGAVTLFNGERDFILVALAWLVLNAKRFSIRRALLALGLAVSIMAVIPVVRRGGFETQTQLQVAHEAGGEEFAKSLFTQGSSNLFVFATVASWIPRFEGYRWGSSYVDALGSFIPFTHSEAPSLATWFKEQYAPTGTAGYGFAMDAEAYLNFGWAGPPLVFLLWGLVLGALASRAQRAHASAVTQFIWIMALSFSLFAVRADSRTLFKSMIYGALVGAAFQAGARAMTYVLSQVRVRTPPARVPPRVPLPPPRLESDA